MPHSIFAEWVGDEPSKEGFHSTSIDLPMPLEAFRSMLQTIHSWRDVHTVVCINAANLTDAHFAVCLKMMESPTLRSPLWFYGLPIEKYPQTIKSRTFLRIGNLTASYHIVVPKTKGRFVDFMRYLDSDVMASHSFNVFYSFMEDASVDYFTLFDMWLAKDARIFTQAEINLCPVLRTKKFRRTWQEFDFYSFPKDFILFLICYIVLSK